MDHSNEILENNELIFDFMGCEHSRDAHINSVEMSRLKYHSSWDWLMQVVDKIEALQKYQVEIDLFSCYIVESSKLFDNDKFLVESHEDSKIKAVWVAVVTFIKWYNSQPVTNSSS